MITINLWDSERITKEYWEYFYANKINNSEINKFLERHKLPKPIQGETTNRIISMSIK